jgi:hypothetical protein
MTWLLISPELQTDAQNRGEPRINKSMVYGTFSEMGAVSLNFINFLNTFRLPDFINL